MSQFIFLCVIILNFSSVSHATEDPEETKAERPVPREETEHTLTRHRTAQSNRSRLHSQASQRSRQSTVCSTQTLNKCLTDARRAIHDKNVRDNEESKQENKNQMIANFEESFLHFNLQRHEDQANLRQQRKKNKKQVQQAEDILDCARKIITSQAGGKLSAAIGLFYLKNIVDLTCKTEDGCDAPYYTNFVDLHTACQNKQKELSESEKKSNKKNNDVQTITPEPDELKINNEIIKTAYLNKEDMAEVIQTIPQNEAYQGLRKLIHDYFYRGSDCTLGGAKLNLFLILPVLGPNFFGGTCRNPLGQSHAVLYHGAIPLFSYMFAHTDELGGGVQIKIEKIQFRMPSNDKDHVIDFGFGRRITETDSDINFIPKWWKQDFVFITNLLQYDYYAFSDKGHSPGNTHMGPGISEENDIVKTSFIKFGLAFTNRQLGYLFRIRKAFSLPSQNAYPLAQLGFFKEPLSRRPDVFPDPCERRASTPVFEYVTQGEGSKIVRQGRASLSFN